MNKIIFVQKEMEDRLGVMLLSGYLKSHGFDSEIIINPHRNIKKIKKKDPDFIGINLLSPSVEWGLETCRFLKKHLPNVLTIFGGPHPTFFPAIVKQDNVDIVCIGEGEKPLLLLMQSYDGTITSIENTPNLWVKKGSTIIKNQVMPLLTSEELTNLPFCDRSHYARYPGLEGSPHRRIMASRGCPYSCSYCFNSNYKAIYKNKGAIVRQRSVDSVIAELKTLKEEGAVVLDFADDHFLPSKDWVLEFCEKHKRCIGLPFVCNSTAQKIDREIVAALKSAGCRSVNFAIESGVESIRRNVYNKSISDDDIFGAAEALNANSMPFLTYNMIGLPEESLEDIYRTVKINQEIKTTYPWCSILQPYPGTALAKRLIKNGEKINALVFTYSYFQESIIESPERQKMIRNAVKLFAFAVKQNSSFKTFTDLIQSNTLKSVLYPFVFYWYYGTGVQKRYGYTWWALFRYWVYSRTT